MITLDKNAFILPRVEREKFVLLLRLGLEYNQNQGTFRINSYNNIEKLAETLSNLLNTNAVVFLQTCLVCGKDFQCDGCKYYAFCPSSNLPFSCVCPECLQEIGRASCRERV